MLETAGFTLILFGLMGLLGITWHIAAWICKVFGWGKKA